MKKEKFITFFIERRKQLGYSQSKIANELGISDQAVSNWERGISFPDISYLDDIAKLLQTNVYSLIEGKQKNIKIKEDIIFNTKRFSLYLSKLRKDKNLTQNELGKILGVSGQNISKFENGGFLPSVELIEKYAKYFNVSFLNIYYGLKDEDLYDNITTKEKNKKIKLYLIPCFIIIFLVVLFLLPNLFIEKHLVTVIINDNEIITYEVKDEDIFTLPSLPNKTGYEASWDNLDTIITEDKTFTVIYTPKKYTITYSFENKEIEDYVQEVTYGEKYELYIPNDEYFMGYTYYDEPFDSGIYEYDYNISVLGKFDEYRTVTIILDKDNIQTYSVKINTEINLPSLPNKIGYEASWDNLDTIITEDKTFSVIYTPKKYTITYLFENKDIEDYVQEVTYGEEYELYVPNDEYFIGYTYYDKPFNSGIYEYDYNISVLGKFDDYRTVTIILDKDNIQSYSIKINTEITLPSLPNKKGYEASWDNLDTLITEDKTFSVIYTPKKYTITYLFENKDIEEYVQEVTYDEYYDLYEPSGNILCEYLYNNEAFKQGVYQYDHSIEVVCTISYVYEVTIILDKDNIQTQHIKENDNIALPELPIKKGYDVKWNDTNTLITEDKTFSVIYTPKKYTITYVFEDDIIKSFTEEVSYGNKYNLFTPQISDYSFVGYTYNDEIIENGIYEYDHDITVFGSFSNEVYKIYRQFSNIMSSEDIGYGCAFQLDALDLSLYLNECFFSPREYNNYKIIGWRDNNSNIYNIGETYIYNNKSNLYLWPILEYLGDAFIVNIENNEATIVKYNIEKITNLIIPDYIVVNNNSYKVTEIASNTFQNTYFMDITLSPNITKIYKNTFWSNVDTSKYSHNGSIFYGGSLYEWFNIDFDENIVCNVRKTKFNLRITNFLVGDSSTKVLVIPEGIEVIKSYSCASLPVLELTISNSVKKIEEHAFIDNIIGLIINLENVEDVHENAFN